MRQSARTPIVDHLTVDEIERLLEALDVGRYGARSVALGLMLWGTGAKISELLGAPIGSLRLHDGETGRLELGDREVVVPARALAAALRYLESRGSPRRGVIFEGQRGGALDRTTVWRMFRCAAARSGLQDRKPGGRWRIHPQTLRNSYAVQMLRAGAEVWEVQRQLGLTISRMEPYLEVIAGEGAAVRHPMGRVEPRSAVSSQR